MANDREKHDAEVGLIVAGAAQALHGLFRESGISEEDKPSAFFDVTLDLFCTSVSVALGILPNEARQPALRAMMDALSERLEFATSGRVTIESTVSEKVTEH